MRAWFLESHSSRGFCPWGGNGAPEADTPRLVSMPGESRPRLAPTLISSPWNPPFGHPRASHPPGSYAGPAFPSFPTSCFFEARYRSPPRILFPRAKSRHLVNLVTVIEIVLTRALVIQMCASLLAQSRSFPDLAQLSHQVPTTPKGTSSI